MLILAPIHEPTPRFITSNTKCCCPRLLLSLSSCRCVMASNTRSIEYHRTLLKQWRFKRTGEPRRMRSKSQRRVPNHWHLLANRAPTSLGEAECDEAAQQLIPESIEAKAMVVSVHRGAAPLFATNSSTAPMVKTCTSFG